MFCQEWSLVKDHVQFQHIKPLYCQSWACHECRPKRTARLIYEANTGKPNLFVTLTTNRRPGRCQHAAARALVRAWRQVRQEYLKEHGPRSLPFLAVFEATKRGWPHLHIVARAKWLDQRWLSRRMGELIGAPIVDVRRVKSVSQVAQYVAKYIGKNPHRFKGVKRYWRSLDYFFPTDETAPVPKDDEPPWQVVKKTLHEIAKEACRRGWWALYHDQGLAIWNPRPP